MGCQSKATRVKALQGLGEQENNIGKGERRDWEPPCEVPGAMDVGV